MKLLLVNIYPSDTIARYLLSSYTLKAYLLGHLREEDGFSVEVLNFSPTLDALKICQRIIKEKPDYIGYSCYIWNIEKILELVKALNERGRFINILGGPEISINRIRLLPDPKAADFYVIGEGERILLNLMRYIIGKGRVRGLKIPSGVAVCNNGSFEYLPDADRIINLDEIPSVYLDGAMEERLYRGQQALLETQRGCSFKCKYCVYHKNLPTVSYYSLERVYKDLDYLIVKKKILALRIFDSIFTNDLPRAKKIVEHLVELKELDGVKIPWIYWEFNYDMVDEQFLRLTSALKYREKILNTSEIEPLNQPQLYGEMVRDYTVINCVGVQSFCKEALKAVGRAPIDTGKFERFMNIVNENNLVLKIDMILGLPFETFDSYFEGLESFLPLFKDTDHILNIHRLSILPGSELERLSDRYKIVHSRGASHLASSTNTLSEKEMNYASKLTAVLFRVVNSPLRSIFFEARERSGADFLGLIEDILNRISSSGEFKDTRLIRDESVEDDYWNGQIYREIPSERLIEILSSYCEDQAPVI